ncbi:MAG TPA: hypothetical protein ENN60_03295 [archaeon]|nr:hypothetical protein [archaeon]
MKGRARLAGVAGLVMWLVLVAGHAWVLGDSYCDRAGGESCMNSKDCHVCQVQVNTSLVYQDTRAMLYVDVFNQEPSALELTLLASKHDEDFHSKHLELVAYGNASHSFMVDREEDDLEIKIIIRDRALGTAWAMSVVTLTGLQSRGRGLNFLTPLFSLILFFGILYWGLKQTRTGRYDEDVAPMMPIMAYSMPSPGSHAELEEQEQVVIKAKKKKYYHRKKGNKP